MKKKVATYLIIAFLAALWNPLIIYANGSLCSEVNPKKIEEFNDQSGQKTDKWQAYQLQKLLDFSFQNENKLFNRISAIYSDKLSDQIEIIYNELTYHEHTKNGCSQVTLDKSKTDEKILNNLENNKNLTNEYNKLRDCFFDEHNPRQNPDVEEMFFLSLMKYISIQTAINLYSELDKPDMQQSHTEDYQLALAYWIEVRKLSEDKKCYSSYVRVKHEMDKLISKILQEIPTAIEVQDTVSDADRIMQRYWTKERYMFAYLDQVAIQQNENSSDSNGNGSEWGEVSTLVNEEKANGNTTPLSVESQSSSDSNGRDSVAEAVSNQELKTKIESIQGKMDELLTSIASTALSTDIENLNNKIDSVLKSLEKDGEIHNKIESIHNKTQTIHNQMQTDQSVVLNNIFKDSIAYIWGKKSDLPKEIGPQRKNNIIKLRNMYLNREKQCNRKFDAISINIFPFSEGRGVFFEFRPIYDQVIAFVYSIIAEYERQQVRNHWNSVIVNVIDGRGVIKNLLDLNLATDSKKKSRQKFETFRKNLIKMQYASTQNVKEGVQNIIGVIREKIEKGEIKKVKIVIITPNDGVPNLNKSGEYQSFTYKPGDKKDIPGEEISVAELFINKKKDATPLQKLAKSFDGKYHAVFLENDGNKEMESRHVFGSMFHDVPRQLFENPIEQNFK